MESELGRGGTTFTVLPPDEYRVSVRTQLLQLHNEQGVIGVVDGANKLTEIVCDHARRGELDMIKYIDIMLEAFRDYFDEHYNDKK